MVPHDVDIVNILFVYFDVVSLLGFEFAVASLFAGNVLIGSLSSPLVSILSYYEHFILTRRFARRRFLLEKSDLIAGAHCHGGYLVEPEAGTSITPSEDVAMKMIGTR